MNMYPEEREEVRKQNKVEKNDIHPIPVAGHESEACPHCGTDEVQIRNDHHYLPYFTVLCMKEECFMETSYCMVYQVCEEPKKREL
jgi:hypothetical protein